MLGDLGQGIIKPILGTGIITLPIFNSGEVRTRTYVDIFRFKYLIKKAKMAGEIKRDLHVLKRREIHMYLHVEIITKQYQSSSRPLSV